MRFPFRLKILGGFLALIFVALGASLAVIHRTQVAQAEREVRRQLEITRGVFEATLRLRAKQQTSSIRLLAADFAFKQALATRDPRTIASAAVNFRERIGADTVWVTDESGRLLADTSMAPGKGKDLSKVPAVAGALEGGASTSVSLLAGKPILFSAVPVDAPDLIGVLATGFRMDKAYATELKRLMLSEVSFLAQGRVTDSTLDAAGLRALDGAGLPAPGSTALVGPRGRRLLTLTAGASPEVSVVLARSWEEALEPAERLQRLLGLIGCAAFALASLLGFLLAGQIAAPVARLVLVAQRLREGEYAARVDIPQRDEIGDLGVAFNEMAAGLEERERMRGELERSLLIRMNLAKFVPTRARAMIENNPGANLLEKRETDVTVLFADITGYTRITARMRPQALTAMVERYFAAFLNEIDRRGGELSGTDGDGLMAIFYDGNHAQVAVETAWAIHRRARELSEEEAAEHEPILMHVGVNTGLALLGATKYEGAAGDRWTYTAQGMTTNLAARLAAQAEGGDTVVSEATLARLTLVAPAEYMGERALKNVEKPMRLYRVRG